MGNTVEIRVVGRDQASAPLKNVNQALTNLGRAAGGVNGPLSGLRSALGGIGTVAGGIMAANVLGGLANTITGTATAALGAVRSYERLTMTMESMVAKELKNAGAAKTMADAYALAGPKAKELLQWQEQLAVESPFKSEDVSGMFRMGMALGFNTEQTKTLTKSILDWGAATGAQGEQMQRAMVALGQMGGKGKVSAEELMQLTEAGINTSGILKELGTSYDQVGKKSLSSAKFLEAFLKVQGDYAGAASRSQNTLDGLIASLDDIKTFRLRDFFTGAFEAAKPVLKDIVAALQSPGVIASIKSWGVSFGNVVSQALKLAGVIPRIASALAPIGAAMARGFSTAQVALEGVSSLVGPLGARLSALSDAFKIGGVQSVADMLGPDMPRVTAMLGDLAGAAGQAVANALPGIVQQLGQWGAAFVDWGVNTGGPMLMSGLEQAFAGITAWFTAKEPEIRLALGSWAAAFGDWAGDAIPRVNIGLLEILISVQDFINNTAVPAINAAVSAAAGAAVDAFLRAAGVAVSGAMNPASTMFMSLGHAAAQGIMLGFINRIAAFPNLVVGTMGGIIGKISPAFGDAYQKGVVAPYEDAKKRLASGAADIVMPAPKIDTSNIRKAINEVDQTTRAVNPYAAMQADWTQQQTALAQQMKDRNAAITRQAAESQRVLANISSRYGTAGANTGRDTLAERGLSAGRSAARGVAQGINQGAAAANAAMSNLFNNMGGVGGAGGAGGGGGAGSKAGKALDDLAKQIKEKAANISTEFQNAFKDIFKATEVTGEDVKATGLGKYADKWDEFARRIKAAVADAGGQWRKMMIPQDVLAQGEDAIKRWGAGQLKAFYEGKMPEQINWDAVKRALDPMGAAVAEGNLDAFNNAQLQLTPEVVKTGQRMGVDLTQSFTDKMTSAEQTKKGADALGAFLLGEPAIQKYLVAGETAADKFVTAMGQKMSGMEVAGPKIKIEINVDTAGGLKEVRASAGKLTGSSEPKTKDLDALIFHTGGIMPWTGYAYLKEGERITPASRTRGDGAVRPSNITTNVNVGVLAGDGAALASLARQIDARNRYARMYAGRVSHD